MLVSNDPATNKHISDLRKASASSTTFRIDFRINPDGTVDLRHDRGGGDIGLGTKAYITGALQFAHRVGGFDKALMMLAAMIQELAANKQKLRTPAAMTSPILGPDATPAIRVEDIP